MMNNLREALAGFVRCIDDLCCDDLRKGSIYAMLADAAAEHRGFVRVIDESGRDRLYPPENFSPARPLPALQRRRR